MEHVKTGERKRAQVDRVLLKTVRTKAARKKAEPARPLLKETRCKPKSDKLICRYCGSDDLAPSFIERRESPMPQVFQ